ncbi:MAG: hypothetical protein FJ303_18855 [Planctomycetes bacterium]|nr:hypothetical protein [Planctomycetota bacterium]
MPSYNFAVIVACEKMTEDQILDATDALGEAGCTDASLRGHSEGFELLFNRSARSMQTAIASAISDVESAGFQVLRVELQREAIQV